MNLNSTDLLASMSVLRAFFKLAIPAVAAQLINILYNLVAISFNTSLQTYGGDMAVASIFTDDVTLIAYTTWSIR